MPSADDDAETGSGAPQTLLIKGGRVLVLDGKTPPTEEPESAAFLEIDDSASGGAAEDRVFSGWMFASSPGLSALEHPVYDVWLLDCSTASSAAEDAPAEN